MLPGIPDTPDLADTYYEQFKDFDKDDSEEADDDNEGTITVKDDEENFINCLEMALDKDEGGEIFFSFVFDLLCINKDSDL